MENESARKVLSKMLRRSEARKKDSRANSHRAGARAGSLKLCELLRRRPVALEMIKSGKKRKLAARGKFSGGIEEQRRPSFYITPCEFSYTTIFFRARAQFVVGMRGLALEYL